MRRIHNWRSVAVLVVAGVILIVAGCLPEDMPAYMDGGKSVAAIAAGKLWVYDVPTGKVKGYALPEHMSEYKMLGDQFLVFPGSDDFYWGGKGCQRFDLIKRAFVPGPTEMKVKSNQSWIDDAIVGSWEGQKCVFALEKERETPKEKNTFALLSLPDLKKFKTVELAGFPMAVGGGWWTAGFSESDDQGRLVRGFSELFDDQGRSVLKIPPESTQNARPDGPCYGRLSADRRVLLLATVWQGGRTPFVVLDVKTGNCLWSGTVEQPLSGNPLVQRDEGWLLERPEETQGVALTRYRRPEKADTQPATRETVLTYPLAEKDEARQYNLSPDGKEFALIIDGPNPRLVFIPIKDGVTVKDLRVVELKDSN